MHANTNKCFSIPLCGGCPPIPVLAALGLRQIEPAEQHCKFFRLHHNAAFGGGGCRPVEPPALQPLGANPESAAIPHQCFDPRSGAVGEQEQMAAQGILAQVITYQAEQAVEAFAHIHRFGAKIDFRCQAESKHFRLHSLDDSDQSRQFLIAIVPVALDSPAAGQFNGEAIGLPLRRLGDPLLPGQFNFYQRCGLAASFLTWPSSATSVVVECGDRDCVLLAILPSG